mgnify:CR=1 FL=1
MTIFCQKWFLLYREMVIIGISIRPPRTNWWSSWVGRAIRIGMFEQKFCCHTKRQRNTVRTIRLTDIFFLACRFLIFKDRAHLICPFSIIAGDVAYMVSQSSSPSSWLYPCDGILLLFWSAFEECATWGKCSCSSNTLSDMCCRTTRFTALQLSANADNSRALLFLN